MEEIHSERTSATMAATEQVQEALQQLQARESTFHARSSSNLSSVVDEVHSFQEILCTQEDEVRALRGRAGREQGCCCDCSGVEHKSRATFEGQSSDRIAESDVAEETMSATVKLTKEIDEPDIGQRTAYAS